MTSVLVTSFYYCRYATSWNAIYWTCCRRVVSTFAACMHVREEHFEHML